MDKKHLSLLLALSLSVLTLSAQAASNAKVFSPEPGVLCDRGYFCSDDQGISNGLTEQYLGKKVADKLAHDDFDRTQFTLTNGIFCDTKEKKCHMDRYFDNGKRSPVSVKYTKLLFGAQSTQTASSEKIFSPEAGVLCDRGGSFCSDDTGIAYGLTETYLGKKASDKLSAKGDFDLTQFTLSNGIFCDTKTKKCYKDRYFENGKRSPISEKYTKLLFGK